MRAIDAHQYQVLILHTGANLGSFLGRWLQRRAVAHELHPHEEASTTHIADQWPPAGQRCEVGTEPRADLARVLLQALVAKNVEHGIPCSATDRIPAERVEVLQAIVEGLRHRAGRDDGRQGHAVAEGLAHRHDVRGHPLLLEGPEVVTQATETHLHLIRHAHPASRSNRRVARRQVPRRRQDDPADRHAGLDDEGGDLPACSLATSSLHILCITLTRIQTPVRTAERARARHLVDVGLRSLTAFVVEFVGADLNRLLGVAVIPVVDHDELPAL
mmetsp:Transcript_121662/g.306009  ORF Transcript_121662/g.306009 Transcript_121662/m.306009 type:complete len:274 (+) Transcript_121662:180-1001(+)